MQPRMGEFTEEWVRQKAHRLYVEAQARMDIERGHTALLVIDMTDEFVKPHWSPYWVPAATRAVPRIKAVIDGFRRVGWPVIYLAYELGQRGLNFPGHRPAGAHHARHRALQGIPLADGIDLRRHRSRPR